MGEPATEIFNRVNFINTLGAIYLFILFINYVFPADTATAAAARNNCFIAAHSTNTTVQGRVIGGSSSRTHFS